MITENKENLQYIITEWVSELTKKGMEVNISKSKILPVSKTKENENIQIINRELMEVVDEYKYLGTIFTRNGKINREIQQSSTVYHQINRTILSKPELHPKQKYKSIILFTFSY